MDVDDATGKVFGNDEQFQKAGHDHQFSTGTPHRIEDGPSKCCIVCEGRGVNHEDWQIESAGTADASRPQTGGDDQDNLRRQFAIPRPLGQICK